MKFNKLCWVLAAALAVASSQADAQSDWDSFQNQGTLQNGSWKLATQWSPDSGIQWETALKGYGQSTPVIHKDRIYLTTVLGDNKEEVSVQAISLNDGKPVWDFKRANSSPEKNTPMVARAASSPVVDENGVIAFFEGGNLLALDHEGKLKWERDLNKEKGGLKARHGIAASLAQNDEVVFVWCERMENPFVLAISKADGKTIWEQAGLGGTSWSSPRLLKVGQENHLVLSGIGIVAGLDPSTGKRLWEFREVSGNSSATPVSVGDGKFLIGASGGRNPNQNSTPSCGVIEVKKSEEGYAVGWDWVADEASCSFGSPIACAGRAYFVNRVGVVHCHDLATGDSVFTSRIPCGQIWATPLASQEHIYFFGKDGKTAVLKVGEKLDVVSENVLWNEENKAPAAGASPENRFSGPVLYAAAVADGRLLLRRGDRLYCLNSAQKGE